MRALILTVGLSALLAACNPPSETPGPTPADPAPTPSEPAPGPSGGDATPPDATAPAPGEQGGSADWRTVVTTDDAALLGRLDQAWRLGRAEAEDRGHAAEVEALGALVDPNAGLAGRLQPAPGDWRCRTIKLGSRDNNGPGYLEYPWFRCTIELTPGGDLILTKVSGSQRTRGLLYPDTDRRLVFVGAQAWGLDEAGYPTYGQMPIRDQVGVFERIGSSRYRLVIPWPRVESKLEILELAR